MFMGHYAIGFAAKRFAPETSLGLLIASALLLDLLWPIFVLIGWEQVRIEKGNTAFTPLNFISYPFSHSLIAAIGWATLLAVVYYVITRYRRGSLVLAVGVISHWVLDFITHRPDMPLYPGGPKLGLSLWNHPVATVFVEGLMYALGVWIYIRVTRDLDRIGRWGLWSLVLLLVALYVANIFSPPPPDINAILIVTMPMVWLLIVWAGWVDRHRAVR